LTEKWGGAPQQWPLVSAFIVLVNSQIKCCCFSRKMAQSTLHVALAVGMLTTGHHVGLCADLEKF